MKEFYVIYYNFNAKKVEPYDIMPYFISEYICTKDKPKTTKEFKEFIKNKARYMFWARCEYEIIICGWPDTDVQEKWDIYNQIMMNIDIVTKILMDNVRASKAT